MDTKKELTQLWKDTIKKDGWGYDIVEADADGIIKLTAEWIDKNFIPVEAGVMQKPAGSADEIFIKGKIEGLEEARWQINYALPHIDPNGRLEKQTKYLMDAFKEVQDELKAKL